MNTLRLLNALVQLALLGGLIWGLLKMGGAVESLRQATAELVQGLKHVTDVLANLTARILILEGTPRKSRP